MGDRDWSLCPSRARQPNMVSSSLKALLLQDCVTFHVRAESTASIIAGAEAVLKELFKKEKKELCGSQEIHKLLTDVPSKSNNRVALWSKIDKIADTKLSSLTKLITETEEKLESAKKELDAKKREAKPEMSAEEIKPMIKQSLLPGFDPASEDQAVVSAKTSGCGTLSPRKCK